MSVLNLSGRILPLFFFFFFKAEDGIRDKLVTGVQTCALPILPRNGSLGVTGARRRPPRRAGARPWGGTGSRARRRLLARRPLAELPREVPRGEPHAQENAGAVGAVPRAWGPVGGAARHRSRPVQRRQIGRA